jgi:hypothetical protein
LSADTIVPSYTNPQNLNRFSYTVNNPLRYTDPTGHFTCSSDKTSDDYCPGSSTSNGTSPTGNSGGGNDGGNEDDTGPITDIILGLPGSDQFYSNVSTAFDFLAWLTDLYAAGIVTYGAIYGAGLTSPFIAAGLPEVPVLTGLAGAAIAELYVQPALTVGNTLATLSTVSTVIADTKAGDTRIEQGMLSSTTTNSSVLTLGGWLNKEAYISFVIQSTAVSNDLGWSSLPFSQFP